MVLTKISIENFLTQETIYSKTIRGNLSFTAETHMLDGGKTLQLYLYRDHPDIDAFIRAAEAKEVLGKQNTKVETGQGTIRLNINDEKFMINSIGDTKIEINELNFNPKDFSIVDFEKGKVAILIDFTLGGEIDNSKFKKEIKDYFMEENDGTSD